MLNWKLTADDILQDKNILLTNSKGFVNTRGDLSFEGEWKGIWIPPYKFVDSVNYKINGQNLNKDNFKECSQMPGMVAYSYSLEDIDLKKFLLMPEGVNSLISVLRITNQNDETREVELELEVKPTYIKYSKIKQDETEETETNFSARFDEVRQAVNVEVKQKKDQIGQILFGAGEFKKQPEISWEEPKKRKNVNEKSFDSGIYKLKVNLEAGEELEIPILISYGKKNAKDHYDCSLESWQDLIREKGEQKLKNLDNSVNLPNKSLEKAFKWSEINLNRHILVQDFGKGRMPALSAGFPQKQFFSSREALWASLALSDLGKFKLVEDQFEILRRHYGPKLPSKIDKLESGEDEPEISFWGEDIDPLFATSYDYYTKVSGKVKGRFSEVARTVTRNPRLKCEGENCIIRHSAHGTWMRDLERSGAIEIQSIWKEALKSVSDTRYKLLEKGLEFFYWNSDYPMDSSDIDELTPNFLIALFEADQEPDQELLDLAQEKLTSDYGIKTLTSESENYTPGSIYQGATSPVLTGLKACLDLEKNNIEAGLGLLNKLAQSMNENSPGLVSESLNSEKGNSIGNESYIWSYAMIVQAIDRYLLGIKPNLIKNVLKLEPKLPDDWDKMERTNKRIGENKLSIKYTRNGNRLEMDLSLEEKSLNGIKKVKVKIPDDLKGCRVNGHPIKIKNSEAEFDPSEMI